MKGTKVGEVYQDQKSFDVVVIGMPSLRTDIEALRRLKIDLPTGGHAPLGDVADVEILPAPNEIKRESASRRLDVTCNVAGSDLGSVAREINAASKASSSQRNIIPNSWASTPPARSRGTAVDAVAGLARNPAAAARRFPILEVDAAGVPDHSLRAGWRGGRAPSCKEACCRWDRWWASSPCWASRPVTASCWSAITGIWNRSKASPLERSSFCAERRAADPDL